MQTLTSTHGLQATAGNLLAALIYSPDANGYIAIKKVVRDAVAHRINPTNQVVVNQLKALSDSHLLIKVKRGHYFYEAILAEKDRGPLSYILIHII